MVRTESLTKSIRRSKASAARHGTDSRDEPHHASQPDAEAGNQAAIQALYLFPKMSPGGSN
jgi:hypothetical protein